jgi:hypothetical protein
MTGILSPDNIQNGRLPGGGDASRKRTEKDHVISILMTNHGVAAVTLFWLSQPSVFHYSVVWSY